MTRAIALEEREIEEHFVRASGPGGQNVNKVASAVQLRFDVARSPSLPDEVKTRLKALAGQRMTREGILIIAAESHRSQVRNRQDALARLVDLIRRAAIRPRIRRPTRPTLASKERRLTAKTTRSRVKTLRGPVGGE